MKNKKDEWNSSNKPPQGCFYQKKNERKVMKDYLKRTWKNKLVALGLLAVSSIPIWLDRDATILALMLVAIIPLFLANRDYIEEGQHDE
jgi:hypothetical protein